jgi:hypothetical protein
MIFAGLHGKIGTYKLVGSNVADWFKVPEELSSL